MVTHNHYLIHSVIYCIPYSLYSRFLYCCARYFIYHLPYVVVMTVLHCHGLSCFCHGSVTWCGPTPNLHCMRWHEVSTYSAIQWCDSECKNVCYTLRQTPKTSYPDWSFVWSCYRQMPSTLKYAMHPSLLVLFKLSVLLFSAFSSANENIFFIKRSSRQHICEANLQIMLFILFIQCNEIFFFKNQPCYKQYI